jgi:hypothetical protein
LKKNPASVIADITFAEARRLSQYFESDPQVAVPIFVSDDEDPEDFKEEEDLDDPVVEEKFFARDAAGRRAVRMIVP